MRASNGFNSGPGAVASSRRASRTAGSSATSRQQRQPAPGAAARASQQQRRQQYAGDNRDQVLGTGEPISAAHRQGALAGQRVGGAVAQVVHHQNRGRQQSGAQADGEHQRRQRKCLQVVGAAHRDRSEEQQHQRVAEAAVAERQRAAGVAHRRRHRCRQHHRQGPATPDHGGHRQHRGTGKHDDGARQHLAAGDQPRLGDARRTHARVSVRPVAGVSPVVVQVGADLDQQRGAQRHHPPQRHCGAVPQRQGAAGQHRGHCRPQGAGPDRQPPAGCGRGVWLHLHRQEFVGCWRRGPSEGWGCARIGHRRRSWGAKSAAGSARSLAAASRRMSPAPPAPRASDRTAWWPPRPAPAGPPDRRNRRSSRP